MLEVEARAVVAQVQTPYENLQVLLASAPQKVHGN